MLSWYAACACACSALLIASGAVQLSLHRRDRGRGAYLSFALLSLLAALQATAVAVLYTTRRPAVAALADIAQWALTSAGLFAWLRLSSTVTGQPGPRLRRVLQGVAAFATTWFAVQAARAPRLPSAPQPAWGELSAQRVALDPWGAAALGAVAACMLLLSSYQWRWSRRHGRFASLALFETCCAVALASDAATAAGAGWLAAPPLVPVANVWLAFGGLLLLVRTLEDLRRNRDDLERMVQARTAELRRTQTGLVQSEKLASVGLIAAGVAHEVNNPAAYALTNLTLLRETVGALGRHRDALLRTLRASAPDAAARLALTDRDVAELDRQCEEALNDAVDGLRRIRDIVSDLKTLSQDVDASAGPVLLHRLVEASVSVAAPTVKHRASIQLQLRPTPPIKGHAGKLSQVIINLLVNAAEAMQQPEGGQVIVRTDTRGDEVLLEVRDNGRGIEADALGSIFEPLYTTKRGGAGMGLAICRRVVEEHGGRLEVESVASEGTTLRILLPRRGELAAPALGDGELAPRDEGSGTRLKHGTVMLLDDELLLVKVLARLLGRRHSVLKAHSVDEALELIERGAQPDLILCDLMMPGKSGADFYEHLLRSRSPLASRVTFMSGGGVPESLRKFVEGAGRPMLDKPVEPEVLMAHVASALAEQGSVTGQASEL